MALAAAAALTTAALSLGACTSGAPPAPPHQARRDTDKTAAWIALHEDLAARLEARLDASPAELVDALQAWLDETASERQALREAIARLDEGATRSEIRYLDEAQALLHRLVVLRRQIEARLHETPTELRRFHRLAATLDR